MSKNLPARSYARRASVDEQQWLNNLEEERFLAETTHLSIRERSLLPARKTTSWSKTQPLFDGELFTLYSSFRDGDTFRFAPSNPHENEAGRSIPQLCCSRVNGGDTRPLCNMAQSATRDYFPRNAQPRLTKCSSDQGRIPTKWGGSMGKEEEIYNEDPRIPFEQRIQDPRIYPEANKTYWHKHKHLPEEEDNFFKDKHVHCSLVCDGHKSWADRKSVFCGPKCLGHKARDDRVWCVQCGGRYHAPGKHLSRKMLDPSKQAIFM